MDIRPSCYPQFWKKHLLGVILCSCWNWSTKLLLCGEAHKGVDSIRPARLPPSDLLHLVSWPISSLLFAGETAKPSSHGLCTVDVSSWRRCCCLYCLALPMWKLQKLISTVSQTGWCRMANGLGSLPAEPFLVSACLANCLSFTPVVCLICTHLVKLIHSHYFSPDRLMSRWYGWSFAATIMKSHCLSPGLKINKNIFWPFTAQKKFRIDVKVHII